MKLVTTNIGERDDFTWLDAWDTWMYAMDIDIDGLYIALPPITYASLRTEDLS